MSFNQSDLQQLLALLGVDATLIPGHALSTTELPPPLEERAALIVRLDLMNTKPPIWRRLRLASDLTLEELHTIIQVTMGWMNMHLHSFDSWIPNSGKEVKVHLTTRYLESEGEGEGLLGEWDVAVSQFLKNTGDRLSYTYDFGDDWRHQIRLEKVEPWVTGSPQAECIAGKRACPPEDCGGPWNFQDFLDGAKRWVRTNPAPDDEWGWLQKEFDPEEFDLSAVNADLLMVGKGGFDEMKLGELLGGIDE